MTCSPMPRPGDFMRDDYGFANAHKWSDVMSLSGARDGCVFSREGKSQVPIWLSWDNRGHVRDDAECYGKTISSFNYLGLRGRGLKDGVLFLCGAGLHDGPRFLVNCD